MEKRKERLFLAVILLLCVLLFVQRLTGEALHGVLGLLLLILVVVHVYRHIAKLKFREKAIQAIDWMSVAALVILAVSGILLHPLQGMLILKMIHKLASVVFVIGMIVHVVQHTLTDEVRQPKA